MDNIERTYRELFGNPQFMIFFDESYEEFRQQIINLPYYIIYLQDLNLILLLLNI